MGFFWFCQTLIVNYSKNSQEVKMKADKVQVSDIKSIGVGGYITVELPNYLACISAKNTVGYVKKAYPRTDNNVYYCRINGSTITIGLADKSKVNRRKRVIE
jgi:hypothetical protein